MGFLIFFGVILVIVLAVRGNKTETVTKIDENGNRTVETHEADSPSAGTVAARVVIGIIVGIIALFFVVAGL